MSPEFDPVVMVMIKRGGGDWVEMTGAELIDQFTTRRDDLEHAA
ncbi:hypothetical protein [Streptomyces sp. WAC07149]|nr:hypothetical protein [Streptomyces sp. WAC07149]